MGIVIVPIFMLAAMWAPMGSALSLNSPGVYKLDWSWAGRGAGGTKPAYYPPRTFDARSYGVYCDGRKNNAKPLQLAIDTAAESGGAIIELPSGTCRLEGPVTISSSNIILRGAGVNKTIIFVPHSRKFYDMMRGDKSDTYSRSKGFIQIKGSKLSGSTSRTLAARVVEDTSVGYRSLTVDDNSKIQIGDWVRLFMKEPSYNTVSRSLSGYLYDNPNPKEQCGQKCMWRLMKQKGDVIFWMSRVSDIRYNTVVLERELPVDVKVEWSPTLHFVPSDEVVWNSGVEDMTLEFEWHRKKKHLEEDGFNAFLVEGAVFSWMKNLEAVNADLNFLVRHSNFVSAYGLTARITKDRSYRKQPGKQGHIAIGIHDSSDIYVSDFDIRTTYWHDLTVRASMLSVFRNGKGKNINLDCHKTNPYMMLYSNIQLGEGTRPFTTGGKDGSGMPSAGYSTFWNIRKSDYKPVDMPGCDYGPKLNFVGNFNARKCKGYYVAPLYSSSPDDVFVYQAKSSRSSPDLLQELNLQE